MKEEYPRSRRITRSSEFKSVTKKGRRVRTLDLDVRLLASPSKCVRVGIVVPRHGHSAAQRNLVKRRLRELVRKLLVPVRGSTDVVLRCDASAYGRAFEELRKQIIDVRYVLTQNETSRT